jgi:DNA mismatch repair protein MutL
MPEIRQLPPSVINKIAAGEVIERPASVVKELMENAVDAGATRVDVSINQGGLEGIRVVDNGCGMRPDQLLLAVASHATSKIQDADDLFRVGTLGFRGEALASIAEVSQLAIRSRTSADTSGAELEVCGGRRSEVSPCGCPVGTVIEVKNLFFNTPVRRKFMRTTQTEMGHASEAFTRIALAFSGVHFTLRHNEKTLFDLPPADDLRERVAAFFDGDLARSLIPVEGRDEEIRLAGYVADPQHSRANNRLQYFFLNGRHIRDKALQHALGEAYRGLLLTGRYPIAFLRLDMPPHVVDVNVHPTKLEVRFQDSGRVYSQLLGSLRKKFLTTDLTARVRPPEANSQPEPAYSVHDDDRLAAHRRELVDWAKGELSQAQRGLALAEPEAEGNLFGANLAFESQGLDLQFDSAPSSALTLHRLVARPPGVDPRSASHHGPAVSGSALPGAAVDGRPQGEWAGDSVSSPLTRHALLRGLQIQNRYIVTETSQGMEIIDQHALHERILYEQIRAKVLAGKLESQRLLVPEPVTLTAAEAAAALEAQETLAQLGIEIAPFGGDTVLVSSYPAMLGRLNPAEILRSAVERLMSGGALLDRRDLLDELLHMCSCKAAIKAGDYLAPEEIAALLEQRHESQDAHHCPHGRPTALVFTREELDRRFKRT